MSYNCNICNKIFSTKGSYTRHINNKDIHIKYKEQITKYMCNCGKIYLHKSSLSYHKLKCNHINTETEYLDTDIESQSKHKLKCNNINTENSDENKTLIDILLKEREQLQQDKEELQKQVELEKQNVETEKLRNTNNIDTQNNDYLNIQINAFGCETLEHVTEAFKVKCLKQIYKSIPEMVIKIHFNTKYPENMNVKIPNKKLPHASIMTKDNTWKTVDKRNTITSMVDKSFNILDDTYEEHKNELTETKRKYYEKYQEKYWNNDKTLHKQLTNDVECLVLDSTR
jgi:uncharacterized C2H2 Zn-finger protein